LGRRFSWFGGHFCSPARTDGLVAVRFPFRRSTLNPRETGGPHLLDALLARNILDPERGIFVRRRADAHDFQRVQLLDDPGNLSLPVGIERTASNSHKLPSTPFQHPASRSCR
jgi:hypothetical protein